MLGYDAHRLMHAGRVHGVTDAYGLVQAGRGACDRRCGSTCLSSHTQGRLHVLGMQVDTHVLAHAGRGVWDP